MELKERIRNLALAKGFDLVRFTSAESFAEDESASIKRIRDGHMDGYSWYTEARVRKMNRPMDLLEGAKSVISLAVSYLGENPGKTRLNYGRIARYAWGEDYHDIIKSKLYTLLNDITANYPDIKGIACVDTSPIMEKVWAQRAGIGWQGKHTNLITRDYGSWLFLGELTLTITILKKLS